jgi:hypothetical protein
MELPKSQRSGGFRLKTNIYETFDYREFLQLSLEWRKKGSGKLSNLARFMGVHPSRLSRILKGPEHPTSEQAYLIGRFIKLTDDEIQYLVELVNLERASQPSYKKHIAQRLEELRGRVRTAAEMNEPGRPLNSREERIFYSSHQYGAVWLCSMIDGQNTLEKISERLRLDKTTVGKISDFLVKTNLCKWKDKTLVPGSRLLNIDATSDQFENFLANWRMHAVDTIEKRKNTDVFHSQPMAIGKNSIVEVKAVLKKAIEQITEILKKNPADSLVCLNIDLFDI